MALDTKYRPPTYDEVLGQEATVAVLRQFVKEGKGFHQSYVFCGARGCGKTTLGRVLARALLCVAPVDGDPCDKCDSCLTLLSGGTHECFEELDAASKSKKEDLDRIINDISYSTFSGRRRIYIFDESHRLSKAALTALLKPTEDTIEGTQEKKLVCIFCTTDPTKMEPTIFSRCAPAFVIRQITPEAIAARLQMICEKEGIPAEFDALVTIAEVSGCHIRDAVKMVEGVSMLGEITKATVSQFLQLDSNDLALTIVEAVGFDLRAAVIAATKMALDVSPSTAYERIAEASACAFRASLGVGKIPSQWDAPRMQELAKRGEALLGVSARFASPPHRPTSQTLLLDVGATHFALGAGVSASHIGSTTIVFAHQADTQARSNQPSTSQKDQTPEVKTPDSAPEGTMAPLRPPTPEAQKAPPPPKVSKSHAAAANEAGIWIDERAIGGGSSSARSAEAAPSIPSSSSPSPARRGPNPDSLDPQLFRELVKHHLRGLKRVVRSSG